MSAENPILSLSAARTEEWRMGIMNKNQNIFFTEHLTATFGTYYVIKIIWLRPFEESLFLQLVDKPKV
jgi:hypothetical protein